MSYDLHFFPNRFDGSTEERINPFTREKAIVPRNAPLSEAEVRAVEGVLGRAGASPSGEGFRVLGLPD